MIIDYIKYIIYKFTANQVRVPEYGQIEELKEANESLRAQSM